MFLERYSKTMHILETFFENFFAKKIYENV